MMSASVYGPNNEKVGTVSDIVIGDDGKVAAILVGVGGFLGIGEKTVAVPYDAVTKTAGSDRPLVVKYSKADLEKAPTFVTLSASQDSSASNSGTGTGAGGAKK
jgi:hypothetical protein